MAEPELEFVQGDTAPDIGAVLHIKGEPDNPIDLTGTTVRFQMRKDNDRKYTVDALATIVDAGDGSVTYGWGTNDLAVEGDYLVQWEVTFADLRKQTTSPNYIRVRRQ